MHYIYLIYIGSAFLVGIFVSLIINFVKKSTADKKILSSNEFAKKIIDDAKQETENLKKAAILEAKEEWYKVQKEYEEEINTRKREIYTLEKEYNERVTKLDNRVENLDKKEEKLQHKGRRVTPLGKSFLDKLSTQIYKVSAPKPVKIVEKKEVPKVEEKKSDVKKPVESKSKVVEVKETVKIEAKK